MPIAPSSYYAAKPWPPSARAVVDEQRLRVIRKVHQDNYGVYAVRKMHAELNRRGHQIARCNVHRLMRAEGLRGISRPRGSRTTVPGSGPGHPAGPAGPRLRRTGTEPGLGCQHPLPPHLRRVGLRRVRHRRPLPPRGGLAAPKEPVHTPWPWMLSKWGQGRWVERCGACAAVDPRARRPRHHRRHRTVGQGRPVPRREVHRATRRRQRRRIRGVDRRLV
jgi:hypothetical protein